MSLLEGQEPPEPTVEPKLEDKVSEPDEPEETKYQEVIPAPSPLVSGVPTPGAISDVYPEIILPDAQEN